MEVVRKIKKDDPPSVPLLREPGTQCEVRLIKSIQKVEGGPGGARPRTLQAACGHSHRFGRSLHPTSCKMQRQFGGESADFKSKIAT